MNIPLPLGLGNHERGTQWAKPGAEFLAWKPGLEDMVLGWGRAADPSP